MNEKGYSPQVLFLKVNNAVALYLNGEFITASNTKNGADDVTIKAAAESLAETYHVGITKITFPNHYPCDWEEIQKSLTQQGAIRVKK